MVVCTSNGTKPARVSETEGSMEGERRGQGFMQEPYAESIVRTGLARAQFRKTGGELTHTVPRNTKPSCEAESSSRTQSSHISK